MQKIENSKEIVNDLAANYRPIGPRHLLAAALALRPRIEVKQEPVQAAA